MNTHAVTFYVRLCADKSFSGKILKLKQTGIFMKHPTCEPDEAAVKVTLQVPDSLFDPTHVALFVGESLNLTPIEGQAQ